MRLVAYADASPQAGLGHLARCLAVAERWRMEVGPASVLTPWLPPAVKARLQERRTRVAAIEVPRAQPPLEAIAEQAASAGMPRPWWAFLDGYEFPESLPSRLRDLGAMTAQVFDSPPRSGPRADLAVFPTLAGDARPFPTRERTLLLAGGRYSLLSPEFRRRASRRKPKRGSLRLLVTLGGGDRGTATASLVRRLLRLRSPTLDLTVVGGPNGLGGEFPRRGPHRLKVLSLSPDMAALMRRHDAVVCSPGVTSLEAACLGIPMALLRIADNQRGNHKAFVEAGAAADLGTAPFPRTSAAEARLRRFLASTALRRSLSQGASAMLDAGGPERVVELMRSLSAPPVNGPLPLRPARPQDAASLWRLANDPASRRFAFAKAPIPIETHLEWFRRKLASPASRIYVLSIGDCVVGQVRFDRLSPHAYEIDFGVHPAFRGRGWGTRLLREGCRTAARSLAARRFVGVVFSGNAASCRAFSSAGFESSDERVIRGRRCREFSMSLGARV